jgi:putative sterol carrier protein
MLGGTFASLDSSEGLGISKTPAEDAQTEITSGSGDIMFVRPIENPESTTENDIQELPGDYIPRNPSDGTSDTPEALSDTIIQGPKANDPDSLGSTKITGPTQNDPENLADTKILRGGESDEPSKLPDTKILREPGEGIEFTSAEELMNYQREKSDDAILKYITIKGKRIPLVDESTGTDARPRSYWNELMKYLGTDDLSVAMEFQKTIDELKKHGNWGKKVAAYLGAILSKNSHFYSSIPEKDINTYKAVVLGGLKYSGKEVEGLYTDASLKKVNPANSGDVEGLEEKRLGTPSYKLPSFSLASGISASSFLRERAENTVGKLAKGSTKKLLLDETLALLVETRDLLEKTTGTYRHRLPGNEDNLGTITSGLVNGGVSLSSAASIGAKLLGNILNTSGTANPLNRPEKDGSERRLGGGAATVWETSTGKTVVFNDDYLQGEGIEITLKELCDQSPSDILSVEDLKNVLQNSKYITTAGKVTDNINRSRVMTLDSNHIWEMRLFPYTGELNGNYSFLPPIREINTMNYMQHGIRTSWSDWIPANSFDLQPKRMVQKTLGLYDGEISYPVSMEFTNELRITLVDDQYKSWKQYFEKCAECSVYLSESHPKEYYTDLDPSTLTPVVRGSIAPAMYKNITFRCLIYVMTPQFSTIKKFDLLVLLKDFAEEWQGESDASSPDLSLSFSVVGENPSDEVVVEKASTKLTKRENTQSKDYTSILSSGLGKVVSVLT